MATSSKTKSGATKRAKVKRQKISLRLSNVVCPENMSIEEWQIALRKQQSEKEFFGISEVDAVLSPGVYTVLNVARAGKYRVTYHCEGHPLNECTCMDFRTSRLGTCKHVEAVKDWIGEKRSRKVHGPDSSLTWMYMDYSGTPVPRVYYGSEDKLAIRKAISKSFDKDGTLLRMGGFRLLDAIAKARNASPFFRCREDVQEYAARMRDDLVRDDRLNEVFRHEDWCKDIFAKGIVPYTYQRKGIEFAAQAGRCIIADEMGLGKTIQAIGTAAILHREGLIESVLVVCPTSLKYQWKREIRRFVGKDALVIEGNQVQRKSMYSAPGLFKIVSYNALNNDVKYAGELRTDMMIMDEVQRLKNWDTQIAHAARRVKSDYTVVLSGTPLENKLEELFSIVQLVDQYLLGPYYAFRKEHIVNSESGKVIGYKGLNEVGKALEPVLLRRRKSEVALELPARMDNNIFVPMTKEQMAVHEENKELAARIIHKWQTTHFLSETDRRRLMIFLANMRMSCDSTFLLDQKTRFDTKVEETMNILESVFASGNEKVVIFSGWERMTRLIAMELDARGIRYSNLNGSVPSIKRKALIDDFTDNPEVRVFLSTDAGSTGLNLQAASYVINLDLPWNPAVLEQRIGRIYRIGQQRNIQVINLVAVGTIEEQMLLKLKFKTDLFDGVLNGGENDVFLPDNKLADMVKDLGFERVPANEDGVITEEESVVDAGEMEHRVETSDNTAETETAEFVESNDDESRPAPKAESVAYAEAPAPEALISQGVSFLDGLMKTLQNPDSSRKLVDALVSENKETGDAEIRIHVKNKETVLQFVTMLGRVLERK